MSKSIPVQEVRQVKRNTGYLLIRFMLILSIVIQAVPTNAQLVEQQAVIKTDYLIYFPPGYSQDTAKKWPVMIYLHGAGLKDRTIEGLKEDYLPWHLSRDKVLQFIVVSPVCRTNGWNITLLNSLYEDIIHKFHVDTDKIYLTGHSMGGFGTWDWATGNPEKFAAIVPVSGCSSSTDSITAWKLRNMPIWVFHGDNDKVVGIECNIEMVKELEKYNHRVKFTIYPGRGHDTWEQTYTNDEMFKWLLDQDRKKNNPVQVHLDKAIYKKYSGQYILDEDTITVGSTGESLYLKPSAGDHIDLLAESELTFSLEDNPSVGIMFRKKNGAVTGFVILDSRGRFARRTDKN